EASDDVGVGLGRVVPHGAGAGQGLGEQVGGYAGFDDLVERGLEVLAAGLPATATLVDVRQLDLFAAGEAEEDVVVAAGVALRFTADELGGLVERGDGDGLDAGGAAAAQEV